MPLEFETIDAYLEFLKVQSPEKFDQVKDKLKGAEKKPKVENDMSENNNRKRTQKSGKLSHICIYGSCQKGKRGGTDYCRKHWLEGQDVELIKDQSELKE